MKKIFITLVCVLSLVSCTKKSHFKDCVLEEQGRDILAYKNSKPYTGEIWSSDDKTIKVECEDGKFVTMYVFHENGTVAFKSDFSTYEQAYYKDNGDTISFMDFKQQYETLYIRMQNISNYEVEESTKR